MDQTGASVTLEVLSPGSSIQGTLGYFAFCGVYLISSTGVDGTVRRAVVDTGHAGLRDQVLDHLRQRDLDASDIDVVALTHAHWDHAQNIDLFPNAAIAVSRKELDYVAAPHADDRATPAWTKYMFRDCRVQDVEPGDELLPGVSVLNAAGHSAGSVAYAVAVGSDTAVITGDALPNAAAATARLPGIVCYDLGEAEATVSRLLEAADILYPGHDRPFRLHGDDVEFLTPPQFGILNATRDMPGLTFTPPGPHEVILHLPA